MRERRGNRHGSRRGGRGDVVVVWCRNHAGRGVHGRRSQASLEAAVALLAGIPSVSRHHGERFDKSVCFGSMKRRMELPQVEKFVVMICKMMEESGKEDLMLG